MTAPTVGGFGCLSGSLIRPTDCEVGWAGAIGEICGFILVSLIDVSVKLIYHAMLLRELKRLGAKQCLASVQAEAEENAMAIITHILETQQKL